MATNYVTNFPIPGISNIFQLIWKLTRVMKASGWTYQASSDTTVANNGSKDTSAVAANDKWGGNANPLNDVYNTSTNNVTINDGYAGGWIVLRGPSTLKMPLNANPSGTLIRGETITQAISNAEGELLGYVWDFAGSTGWAVIMPHTGTFDMTNTVTGSYSHATFIPKSAGTLVTYIREIMFARDSSSVANGKVNGAIFYICADSVAESAMLFSSLATQSGCTATVPPGGGNGGNNAMPSKGIYFKGNFSAGVAYTGWFSSTGGAATTTYTVSNNGQTACINATPASGVTADGSFYACCSNTVSANGADGIIFTRLDDTEPGDVDPYAWYAYNGGNNSGTGTVATWTNTGVQAAISFTGPTLTAGNMLAKNVPSWLGYAARGCPVTARDGYATWIGTALSVTGTGGGGSYLISSGGTGSAAPNFGFSPFFLLNHPNSSPPQLKEPIMLATCAANAGITGSSKQIKGRTRWIQLGPCYGSTYDTYDNKAWLVVNAPVQGAVTTPPTILLPYDGSTTPIQ